ncbi:hypothetical protein M8818_004266 [Zalaria obscura]|uniref:Uncharacterized protein n=1 Tax=Zalaria obscura TaxID=2024903 RepID=A0ACC3SDZ5_9PEZI
MTRPSAPVALARLDILQFTVKLNAVRAASTLSAIKRGAFAEKFGSERTRARPGKRTFERSDRADRLYGRDDGRDRGFKRGGINEEEGYRTRSREYRGDHTRQSQDGTSERGSQRRYTFSGHDTQTQPSAAAELLAPYLEQGRELYLSAIRQQIATEELGIDSTDDNAFAEKAAMKKLLKQAMKEPSQEARKAAQICNRLRFVVLPAGQAGRNRLGYKADPATVNFSWTGTTPWNQDLVKEVIKAEVERAVARRHSGEKDYSSVSLQSQLDALAKAVEQQQEKPESIQASTPIPAKENQWPPKERSDDLDLGFGTGRSGERFREQRLSPFAGSRGNEDARPSRSFRDYGRSDGHDNFVSIPYTTAASEFLYGANAVLAALRAQRRKLYKLYLHRSASSTRGSEIDVAARYAKVPIERVSDSFLSVMDKVSQGRPHNGIVLEASRVPFPPVLSLHRYEPGTTAMSFELAPQTREDELVNGTSTTLKIPALRPHFPLVVLLDGITDPQNVGNILRTCYFYGVDAVGICINTCAPLSSPFLVKAGSGATEALSLFALPKPGHFVSSSRANGWGVFSAVGPDFQPQPKNSSAIDGRRKRERMRLRTDTMFSPLAQGPAILMLGGEGEGLRPLMREKASGLVTIPGGRRLGSGAVDIGVDSLNVGAAAAVLVEAFMRMPRKQVERGELGGESSKETAGEDDVTSFFPADLVE